MELTTPIDFPKPHFTFSYRQPILLMGSCFADAVGERMKQQRFPVDVNPFGTLYNPASVARGLRRLLAPKPYEADELFEQEGLFHSFDHHSRFSKGSAEECLKEMNESLSRSADLLSQASRLVITFGTAWVFRLKGEENRIVSNCHKLPADLFIRERMDVDSIVSLWTETLTALWEKYPDVKVLFTVSPIRHLADGAHGNQLSKSTLLLATDTIIKTFPERTDYFPAFELFMDELRDYRFYAADMVHPSALAADYVWERFAAHYLDKESGELLTEIQEIGKALAHRPFHPESEAYKKFMFQTMLKIKSIQDKFPYFDLSNEMDAVKKKL